MKKKLLMLLPLMGVMMLSACAGSADFTPAHGGLKPWSGDSGGGSGSQEEEEKNTTIEFYFSNSYTEEPIFSVEWYMLKPLGGCPSEVDSVDKVKALGEAKGYIIDPAYPDFIGFSFYGACLDEDNLWDYTKDHKQQAVTKLFGIWVSR